MRVAAGFVCLSAIALSGAAVAQQAAQPAAEAQLPEVTVTQKKAPAPAKKKAAAKKQTAPSKAKSSAPAVAQSEPSDGPSEASGGAAGTAVPGTVVERTTMNTTASIGAPPPTFAGGQVAKGLSAGALGNRALLDLSVAGASYTAKLLQDRQETSPQDLEKYDASVFSNFTRGGRLRDVNVRGLQSTYQVDNVPILFPGSISFEPYDRLEVVKGVTSTALGHISGFSLININLIPKRAEEDPRTDVTTRYLGRSAFGTHVDVGRRYGTEKEFGIRINAAFDDGEATVDGSDLDTRVGHVALDYRGERLRLSLDIDGNRVAPRGTQLGFGLDSGLDIPRVPDPSGRAGQPWIGYKTERLYGIARAEFDVVPNWTVGVVGSVNKALERGIPDGFAFITNNNGDYVFETSVADGRDAESDVQQAYVRGQFWTGPISHRPAFFATRSREFSDNNQFNLVTCDGNLFNPVICPKPPVPSQTKSALLGERELEGYVAADEIGFLNDSVMLTVGARHTKLENSTERPPSGLPPTVFEGQDTTPLVGIVVKPMPWLAVFANYAESLEFGSVAPNNAANRGESTAPITGSQYEIGAKVDFGPFGASVAYFNIERDSAFLDVTTNTFGLFGLQRNEGFELSVYGEVAPGIKVISGATWIDPVFLKAFDPSLVGNTVPAVPELRLVGTVELDLAKTVGVLPGVSVYGTAVYTDETYFDAVNERVLDSFTTLDAGFAYDADAFGINTTLRFAVQNVTNERYWTSNSIADLNIGAPRTFLGSMTTRF